MDQKRNFLFPLNSKYKIKLHSSSMLLAGLCSLTPAAYALSVSSQTPAVNALDQNADSDITIVFDEAMGNSITGNFIVNGSLSGPIDGAFTPSGNNITFNPINDFKPGEIVTTTLTTGLQSSGGSSLSIPKTSEFTVKAGNGGIFSDSGQSLGSSKSYGVSLGDVDADGDLDAVVANYNQANKLWLNDGSGNFTDGGQSLGSSNSRSVSLGDVDGDGDLDAVVANYNQANKLWLNDGSGNFTDGGQFSGSSKSQGVSLGDVDGDGDLDAVVANYNQANKLWLNDGSGNFTDGGQSLGSSLSFGVSLGDVDGDGDLDAMVANFNQANKLWLNDGSGTFTDGGQSLGSSSSLGVSLGDVDGDGDLDAVVANRGQANKLWLNDGSGTFTDGGQSLGSSNSYGVSLGDVDGDGDLDAVVANNNQANKLWLNDGSGNFTDGGQSLGSSNSYGVSLGDVDGDGDLDAVVANYNQANKLWLNNPPPMSAASITASPTVNTNAVTANSEITLTLPNSMTGTASANADKFIVRGSLSGNITGALTDSGTDLIFNPTTDLKPGETVTVTLKADVISADGLGLDKAFSYAFTIQTPASSPGNFLDSGQSLGSSWSQSVSLGDVDDDGDLDAVVANNNQANKLWLNDGSGNFTDGGQSLGSSSSQSVSLGDVDGDGDLDAVVANYNQANKLWLNDGSGNFTDGGQSLGSSNSTNVSLGDVDGDGDLDAVVANNNQANKLWLNDGSGNFTDGGQSLGSSSSLGVSLGDVDGDGDLDAVVANRNQANKLWLNDGSGNFTDGGQSLGSLSSQSVSLGDVDGDGDLDAVVANYNEANKLWLNDGSGTFTDSGQSLGSSNSRGVSLGDVDGDGDLDAMVANQNQANKLWLNNPPPNEAPINVIQASTQTIDEDNQLVFSANNNNLISISDVDVGSNDLQISLTVTDASLSLTGTTDLDITTGTGTDDASMVFTGTVADINTALAGMSFTPTADFNGNSTLTIETNDLGNTGAGGALSDTDTITITVDSVNDIPSFTKGADQTVNEDSGAQTINNWATDISAGPSDESSQTLSFTVTNDNNSLFSVQPAIDATGILSFTPAADATGSAVVTVILNDGTDDSAAQTFNITISDANEQPSNTVPAAQTTNEDIPLVFSTANTNQISIADSDAGNNEVQVTLTVTNGTVTLSGISGLTSITGNDTNNVVLTGTVADINTALEGMSFTPTAEFNGDATIQIELDDQSSLGALSDTDTVTITVNPVNDIPSFTKGADQTLFVNAGLQNIDLWATDISAGPANESSQTLTFTVTNDNNAIFSAQPAIDATGTLSFTPASAGSATVTVILNDGTDDSAAQTFNITISDVNEQPSNTVPATQNTNEGSALTFSAENTNLISIADSDAGNNEVQVTLTVTNGTVTLSGISGLTSITGNDTNNVVLTGTVADINTALEGMSFTPTAEFNGDATIQIELDDQSSLGALSDTDTVTITVNPVNDIPSFTKGADQTVNEDSGAQTVNNWATDISAGPSDESSQTLSFTVTNDNNSLFSVQPAIDATGILSFTPAADATGSVVVTVILNDGTDDSAAQSFNITINSVASTPVQTTPVQTTPVQTTPEQTGCTVAASINCTIQNEGTITDVKIEPEGTIEGGTVKGEIENQGTLQDVSLDADTSIDGGQIQGQIQGKPEAPAILNNVQVNEKTKLSNVIIENNVILPEDVILIDVQLRGSSVNGGTLQGTIRTSSSATVIKNVSLGENTQIIGGKLAGTISGTPKNPAILQHLKVEPETKLIAVIIADGVDIPKDVNLSSGVRFTKADNIPEGVDLTETLPNITPDIVEVKQPSAVDLSSDPIINGIGLLAKINILPVIVTTTNKVNQSGNTGFLTLKIETIFFAVIPMQVQHVETKTRASDTGIRLGFGQKVYFTTLDGIEVIANPAVQDLKLLKAALAKINLPTLSINNDGNIEIPATDKLSYFARPDLASTTVDQETPIGFINKENGNVALVFEDEDGQKREQILYPTPANIPAIEEFTTEAELTPEGNLTFKLGEQNYEGKLDYAVVHGEAPTDAKLEVTNIDDKQLLIVYPDGLRQILKLK